MDFETTKNMQVALGVFVILFCFDVILKRTKLDRKGNLDFRDDVGIEYG